MKTTDQQGTSQTTAAEAPAAARTFTTFLGEVEDGRLAGELTEQLRELVGGLRRYEQHAGGKPKGKLVLTLNVKLDGGIYEVVGDVKIATPKPPRMRSIMYATRGDDLSAQNPRQLELGVEARTVATEQPAAVRVVR